MPDYKEILYDKQRGGVLITLNRPEALERDHPADVEGDPSRARSKPKPIRRSAPSSSPAPDALSAPDSIRRRPAVGAAIFNGPMAFKPA